MARSSILSDYVLPRIQSGTDMSARSLGLTTICSTICATQSGMVFLAGQAAIYGRDPNWGRIACAAGYAGVPFDPLALQIYLGEFHLMEKGQPLNFDRSHILPIYASFEITSCYYLQSQ